MPRSSVRSGPLAHLLVLDLSSFLAGPYASQILADLGARVIKVEPPGGEYTRTLPPHFVKGASAYYLSANRNKESIVIDLKKPQGKDLFLKLIEKSDIVLENFRPGVMDRLGLDYAKLASVNRRLIECSISGFGQDGPYRDRPAYDMVVQALSGMMSINGELGGPPVRLGAPLGDLTAGLYAVIGTLAALSERNITGLGRHVDISMLDCQVSSLSYLAVYYLVSGQVPGTQGRGHVSIPTYRSFTCADATDIIITAITEEMWRALCKVLDLDGLIDDPRFVTNEQRLRHKESLWQLLEAAFLKRTSAEWLRSLQAEGIPAAAVNTIDRALEDPQVLHREMVVQIEHPDGDSIRLLGNPVKFADSSGESFAWPPELGEHTCSVLSEILDLKPDQLQELEALAVIGVPSK